MENASKALLIAGAVLIVILLIAFGMSIFTSAKPTTDSLKDAMSATEIATFNNRFTAYFGENKSAAQAKALANVVVAHNAKAADGKEVYIIIDKKETGSCGVSSVKTKDAKTITNKVSQLSGSGKIEVTELSGSLIKTITLTY